MELILLGNPRKTGTDQAMLRLVRWAIYHQVDQIYLTLEFRDLFKKIITESEFSNHSLAHCIFEPKDTVWRAQVLAGMHPKQALIVCFGGDGSLIHAVRSVQPCVLPVLGVNLPGSLGFNMSAELDQIESVLDAWHLEQCVISRRMLMGVRWMRKGELVAESMAVNDVTLAKPPQARLLHLTLSQGNCVVSSFAADGLIIATPTGSTAYNLSAGGPILYPTMRALVVTAMCPHTLSARPVVLDPTPPLTLRYRGRPSELDAGGGGDVGLLLDGQELWPILENDEILISEASYALHLVSRGAEQFFIRLHHKLSWSERPDSAQPPLLPESQK